MSSLAYKESIRTEMLDGKVVMMSPCPVINHNIVSGKLYRIFGDFFEGKPCTVFTDGVDVYLTKKDRVIPDLMVVCNKDIIKPNGIYGSPDLIVEVLSPSTAKRDKGYKKDLYERCGIKEYWIVEIASRSIEIYTLTEGKYILHDVQVIFHDYEIEVMTDEERADIKYEFSPVLFPDMSIVIEKVFADVF